MRGSKREKPKGSGVWELRVFLGRDPYSKKQLAISKTFAGTSKQADSELAKLVVEAEQGRHKGRNRTVASVFDDWLSHLAALGRSPTTLVNYESKARTIKGSPLGALPLSKVTAEQINGFYRDQLRSGKSPTTVHHFHRILSTALKFAEDQDWVNWQGRSPVSKSSPPAPDNSEAFEPSVDQVLAVIQAAEASRQPAMADFLRLAALTGMRRGEVCGLRWTDVDWDRGLLTVGRSIYQVPGRVGEKTTKNRRIKRVQLGSGGVHLLARLRERAEAEAREARIVLRDDGYIFSGQEDGSTPWTPNRVTQFMTRLRNRLNIPDFHLHSLRHWSGTALVEAGIDVRNVAGRLGHTDGGSLLLSRYAHRSDEQDRKAGEVLSTHLRLSDT